jgi:hypothetical protein
MNFYLKHKFFLMYFKIPYDFTILRSVFTIRVWFACSVPCQNRDFDNLVVHDSRFHIIGQAIQVLSRINKSGYIIIYLLLPSPSGQLIEEVSQYVWINEVLIKSKLNVLHIKQRRNRRKPWMFFNFRKLPTIMSTCCHETFFKIFLL